MFCTRRDGRAAEGAPLLREYGVYSLIEGSNPSLSATLRAALKRALQRIIAPARLRTLSQSASVMFLAMFIVLLAHAPTVYADTHTSEEAEETMETGEAEEAGESAGMTEEPRYKKTVVVEPDDPDKPVVTIFTDDRSIKDLSNEVEAQSPSRSAPYIPAPRVIRTLTSAVSDTAEPVATGAPSMSTKMSTEQESSKLPDILGDQDDSNRWLIWALVAAVLIVGGLIYIRSRRANSNNSSGSNNGSRLPG